MLSQKTVFLTLLVGFVIAGLVITAPATAEKTVTLWSHLSQGDDRLSNVFRETLSPRRHRSRIRLR